MLFFNMKARCIFTVVFVLLLVCSVIGIFVDFPKEQLLRGLAFLAITINYVLISIDKRGFRKTGVLAVTVLVLATISLIILGYIELLFGKTGNFWFILAILFNLFIYLKIMNKVDSIDYV